MKRSDVYIPLVLGLASISVFCWSIDIPWWGIVTLLMGIQWLASAEIKGAKRLEEQAAKKADEEKLLAWAKKQAGRS